MKEKLDFKKRINELIFENYSNEEIIAKIKSEYKIFLTNDQIDNLRRKLGFDNKSLNSNSIDQIILEVLKTQPIPISAREICSLIKRNYGNLIVTRREVRQVIWRQLIDKIDYDRHSFRYSVKTIDSDSNNVDILDFFQIKKEVDLALMTKNFIRRDSTFLNTGYKSLDKLINSYLYNTKVSEYDYIFLERKLEEHRLDVSTLHKKTSVKLKNFHKIEDLIHIIYEDHVIKDYELEYLKTKLELNDIPDLIGNKRFWQISLFYYYDVLNQLEGFSRLIRLVYILLHIDFEEVKDTVLSFSFINIYDSENLNEILMKGNGILEKKLKSALRKNYFFVNEKEIEVDNILAEIIYNSVENNVESTNAKTAFTTSIKTNVPQKKRNENSGKKIEKTKVPIIPISEILAELNKEDSDLIIKFVQNGNRLSAFFKYSNCMANQYSKKEIEQYFEEIWDNFS